LSGTQRTDNKKSIPLQNDNPDNLVNKVHYTHKDISQSSFIEDQKIINITGSKPDLIQYSEHTKENIKTNNSNAKSNNSSKPNLVYN